MSCKFAETLNEKLNKVVSYKQDARIMHIQKKEKDNHQTAEQNNQIEQSNRTMKSNNVIEKWNGAME